MVPHPRRLDIRHQRHQPGWQSATSPHNVISPASQTHCSCDWRAVSEGSGQGRGGAGMQAVPVPQQPHPRCGSKVGGCLLLLLCRDDCHGLLQAGLQAGSSLSGVICIAGNARSCNRAPCDGASPGGTEEWGHLLPLSRQGLFLILLSNTQKPQSQLKTLCLGLCKYMEKDNC